MHQKESKSESLDKKYVQEFIETTFKPIFILGIQRSGTSILYKILNQTGNFNIVTAYHILHAENLIYNHVTGQEKTVKKKLMYNLQQHAQINRGIDKLEITSDFPEEYGFFLSKKIKKPCLTKESLPYFIDFCKKIQYISQTNKPLLLKNPFDFSNILFIKQSFPDAQFIFIHRNPLKTLNSQLNAMRTLLKKKSYYMALLSPEYNKIFDNPLLLMYYRFIYSDKTRLRLRSALKRFQDHVSRLLQDIKKIPQHDFIDITYESLCNTPEATIQHIMHFLNIEMSRQPDYTRLLRPRKTKWLPEIIGSKKEIKLKLQPYLKYCGYEELLYQ